MHLRDWHGYASIGGVVYVMRDYDRYDVRLMRHEAEHLRQIERDGRLLFAIKYLYWLCRYGYQKIPY